MTKARTVAAKKRAKKRRTRANRITMPNDETVPQQAAQGRRETTEAADVVALEARARQTGLTIEQCRDQMAGCAVGRRLLIDQIADVADLWQAVQHMRRVVLAHDRACGSPKRHAQCLRIMLPNPEFRADATSPAPDLRTPEDRDRQAVAAWAALMGWLSCADPAAQAACRRAVVDEPDEPIADWSGIVLALRCVSDGIKGRPMRDRRRC